MRILLTNDDGIFAEGLEILERIARTLTDDVWIVAPETDQSGFAHSLSLSNPLRMRKIDDRRFSVRGTPTDCVIMGVRKLMPEPPDLILSGVNSGTNMADDVTYSGTVAGAMEGTLLGIRSIALSSAYGVKNEERAVYWETAETHGPAIVRKLAEADLPKGVLFNVNFPNCKPDEVRGTLVTTQGKIVHGLWVDQRADGRGLPYYWLRFGREPVDAGEGTDLAAIGAGNISITPLHMDLTAHAASHALEAVFA